MILSYTDRGQAQIAIARLREGLNHIMDGGGAVFSLVTYPEDGEQRKR